MAITTNVPSTNTSSAFAAQVSWTLSPAVPSVSIGGTSGSDSISATATATSSSGTFAVTQVKGTRSSTNTYSASNQVKVTFTASNASWSRNNCNVYFNTSSSGSSWSNVASSATVATGTGKTLALQLSNTTVSSMNGRYFSASVNMGYSTTIQYSLDNSTWQSSGNFSGLTPNTTYTVYVRAYTTSASGNSSSYGYSSKSFALGSKPDNLQISCTARTKNSLTIQVSAGNMGTTGTYELYYAKNMTSNWTKIDLGTSTSTVITGLSPSTEYKFFLKATNSIGTTVSVNLPNGYTPLDYIASTGTQYIATDYEPIGTAAITARFKFNSTTVQQRVFGTSGTLFYQVYINESGGFSWALQNNDGNWTATGVTANTNTHEITVDGTNNKVFVDGSQTNTISTTHTNNSNYPMYILQLNNAGSLYATYSNENIYYLYSIENGVIVRYFIPCKNSSNVAGMYDVLTDTFYENAGTGTFTQGSEIENYQAIYETNENIPGGLRIKIGADWVLGQPYIKINNAWVKCDAVYYKDGDDWIQARL